MYWLTTDTPMGGDEREAAVRVWGHAVQQQAFAVATVAQMSVQYPHAALGEFARFLTAHAA